ncbi:MAG: hypothetical protein OMM_07449 [Candidatus Magnetoglobus multicellularis str. Araruama]|uniref:UDP-N-acetylenolpyruvoylglucosamine reductase n=1 Tax=Candidatus Magnetoglobus multicellularis str. Araruama TaxID=890399 RepID=A0A1V1PCP2_9BACT|nr:MAG: hypothetical protein OMM_07449 [Candidatus Magnetoglobus multicellularis str. Araruama]
MYRNRWTTTLYKKNALKIGYRSMTWDNHIPDAIVVQANLVLKTENKHSIRQDARQRLKYRKSTQPIGCACAGSFFKNPSSELSAGYLIEQAGLKGYRIGHAAVSSRHANFIINLGQATSQEIEDLMHFIQEKVFMQFNVQLQPEVQIIHV